MSSVGAVGARMGKASISLLAGLVAATGPMPISAAAQDATAGERLFRMRCASCHSIQPGQNRVGPSLDGIVGRKAGSVEGARYSQALRQAELTWDMARLDAFLANPRATVAGTSMTVAVPGAADRAAILAYLQAPAAAAN